MSDFKDQKEVQQFAKNLSGKTKLNVSKISNVMGLSRQTYQKKVDTLREQSIISNFTININPYIRPNNLKYVMIEIKTNPKEPNIVEELLTIPQMVMLDGIVGEYSLFALFIFNSQEEYYQTLKLIDETMAKSYFKKYQIIETIRVFKTNGISLRNLKISFDAAKKFDLKRIARTNSEINYNPEKFPGLVSSIKDLNVTIIIFENGKIVIDGLNRDVKFDEIEARIENYLRKLGIKFDEIAHNQNPDLDKIDYEILSILRDGQGLKPISTYEMKNIFNTQLNIEISQSTIHNRIKKLEQQGIILNYTVNFSPADIGFKGKYLLRIKPKDLSKYNDLASRLELNKNITDLFRIGEQYGLLAIVRVKKVEDYSSFIRKLYLMEEIEDTFTNFVLDELKPYTNFVIF
ncbi:MAG: Lrp/AsnC ligand binding domain-containing protein [Promethearchaeota archaeon]|jgi:DNA-binding Lrp family transcriptional regulator